MQSLREAANGQLFVGTAIGQGYLTPSQPASDRPLCSRPCAKQPGCVGGADHLCGCAADGSQVVLRCAGKGATITKIVFAAVGTPTGKSCPGNFSRGACDGDPAKAAAYVHGRCIGRDTCTLQADIKTFNGGQDPCVGTPKHIQVEVVCSSAQPTPPPPPPAEQRPSGMSTYPPHAEPPWQPGVHTAARYRAVAAREYDMVSPENACKFDATEPEAPGTFSFGGCDMIADFTHDEMGSRGNGKPEYFGTAVVWGIALPNWLTGGHYNASTLEEHLLAHVAGFMRHYSIGQSRMESVVLVNEAASNGLKIGAPQDGMFKHNVYYPAIPDYVELSFKAARAAAPNIKLFFNEYGWGVGARFDVVYHMLSDFRRKRIPIDGVGLQMHCDVGSWGGDSLRFAQSLSQNIANITETFDVEFRITEMDVTCGGYSHPCSTSQFEKQAQVYGDVLTACLNNTKCTAFMTWGFSDLHTWMGTGKRPLPFDVNYKPKPAYWELLATLQQHPRTRRTATEDEVVHDAADRAPAADAAICNNVSLGNICCSLNGRLTAGKCQCYPPWAGENCEKMTFKPYKGGRPAYGTPPVYDKSGQRTYYGNFTWGGNPVFYQKRWHLFVSAMPVGTNLSNWGQSLVHHAIAPNISGPYVYNQTALTPGHNPAIMRLTDGLFALFSILDYGVHTSLTPYGPWSKVTQAVDCKQAHQPLCYCNNPSPWLHRNGTIFLACGGGGPNVDGIWRSQNLTGPWERVLGHMTFNHVRADGNRPPIGGGFEDPHLFFDARDNLHLLFHAFGNEPAVVNASCKGTLTSAHAFSPDGFRWFVSPGVPYPSSVTGPANETQLFWSRERPKIVWSADRKKMTHLVTAVAPEPRSNDATSLRYSSCVRGTPCSNCKGQVFTETIVAEFDV